MMLWVVFLLLGWHCLADYPLQGDFLARAKNHTAPIPGMPWYQALGAHALIHGVGVAVITGDLLLGLAETVAHFAIDHAKCAGLIGYDHDQALHVACKVAWVGILVAMGKP